MDGTVLLSVSRRRGLNHSLGAYIHLASFAVNQHHVTWLDLSNHLHDALGICMRTEREMLHLALDLERRLLVNVDLLRSHNRYSESENNSTIAEKEPKGARARTVDLALPARSLLPTVPTTQ